MITPRQYLRMIWIRRRLAAAVALGIASVGGAWALSQPRLFSADAFLVLDVRPDPLLGSLGAAAGMATQVELLKTEKTASRAVQILGLDKEPKQVEAWRKATEGRVPIERYLAAGLQRGITVESVRGSNIISITYASSERGFAMKAANAYADAATDIALEMRVEPARESAEWLSAQTGSLRAGLEQAQARLSKYQQDNGIVFSDEKVGLETARLSALEAQLVNAQTERAEAQGRQRNGGTSMSPEFQRSAVAQGLLAQLGALQAKLAEVSDVLGSGHPQRIQLESQIASVKQQLAAESERVVGSTSISSRISQQKVDELRSLVEAQKQQVLALRSQRDRMDVLLRDVETARRAYESVSQRTSQLALESRANNAGVRLLSTAVEETDSSRKKLFVRMLAAVLGGLAVGGGLAVALELRDRRVRHLDDLIVDGLVPLLGVLHPAGSTAPVYRSLPLDAPLPRTPLLVSPRVLP